MIIYNYLFPHFPYFIWLCNIIDDKNFEFNSLEPPPPPPRTGGLKTPHAPTETCRNAKKWKFWILFWSGKIVFQWTKKNHLGHFDWNCLGSRYSIRPNTQNMAILAENRCLRLKVMLRGPKLWVNLILNVIAIHLRSLEHILSKMVHNQNFHFLVFL